MSQTIRVGGDQVNQVLTLPDAADAIEADLRQFDADADPPRWALELHAGELLVMPCERPELGGVKLVTLTDAPRLEPTGNPETRLLGVYLLWATRTLTPIAQIDAPALTALRTGALSLVATRLLAPPAARRAVVFGTGPQGWAHLRCMAGFPGVEWVGVVSRQPERAEAMVARAAELGVVAEAVGAGAVSEADIICTATSSATPVFDGNLLKDNVHVNAIGSHKPARSELDDVTMSRATIVAVDTPAAWTSAGELRLRSPRSVTSQQRLTLRQLLTSAEHPGRLQGVSVFKSVGAAYADLAVASALYSRVAPGAGL